MKGIKRNGSLLFTASVVLLFGLSLLACNPNKERQNLYGTWIMESLDGQPVPTNSLFVARFYPQGTEMHAAGVIEDSVTRWGERDDYTYEFVGNEGSNVLLTGVSPSNQKVRIFFDVQTLTKDKFVYTFANPGMVGSFLSKGNIVTLRKSDVDYSKQIVGLWEGTVGLGHRFDFKADGTYDFYVNLSGEWKIINGRNVAYHLYGDLLICDVFNSKAVSGKDGYDAWIIHIEGDQMTMDAKRGSTLSERHLALKRLPNE